MPLAEQFIVLYGECCAGPAYDASAAIHDCGAVLAVSLDNWVSYTYQCPVCHMLRYVINDEDEIVNDFRDESHPTAIAALNTTLTSHENSVEG